MKKNYLILMFAGLLLFPVLSFSLTVNPTNFISQLGSITNGTVVYMEGGTYNLSSSDITAFQNAVNGKSNVSIQELSGHNVILKANNTYQQVLKFSNCTGLLVKNVALDNIKLLYESCTNSIMDGITLVRAVFNVSGDAKEFGKLQSIVAINYGDNVTIKNCNIDYTGTLNIKLCKSYRGKNHKFINNVMKGKIQGGYEIWSASGQPVSNVLIQGGSIERINANVTGGEDHGLYLHDLDGVVVDGVTFRGWTHDASGYGVKLKGVSNTEVKNCSFYTSGIMIRVSSGWTTGNTHIWIHHNNVYNGNISSWASSDLNGGVTIQNSCIIENNNISDLNIVANTEDPVRFNKYNNLAQKNGGVFNNCTKIANELKAGINNSGNGIGCTIGSGAATSISSTASVNGNSIDMTATVDGTITGGVRFELDGVWQSADSTEPYSYSMTNVSAGSHVVSVYTQSSDGTWLNGIDHNVTIGIDGGVSTGKWYRIVNQNSGKAIDVPASSTSTGTELIQYTPSTGNNQQWELIDAGNGYYYIRSRVSGLNMDVYGASISDGAKIIQWTSGTGDNQKWKFIDLGNGYYNIECKKSSKNIDVEGSSISNSAKIIQNAASSANCQKWKMEVMQLKSASISIEPIGSTSETSAIEIYPNPFSNSLTVKAEGYDEALFLDIAGKVLFKNAMDDNNQTEFYPLYSEAPAGIYFVKLISVDKVKTVKVIRR